MALFVVVMQVTSNGRATLIFNVLLSQARYGDLLTLTELCRLAAFCESIYVLLTVSALRHSFGNLHRTF